MAATVIYTKDEIESLNRQRLGTKGREYIDNEGNKYIGIENGWIKIKDKGVDTTFNATSTLPQENVQDAIEAIDTRVSTRSKQVEIDFGSELYQKQKMFVIMDGDVVAGDIIIAQLAYDAPPGKDVEELWLEDIIFKCGAFDGGFNMLATSLIGSVTDKFLVNYYINY